MAFTVPVASDERLLHLDVLRGFALFGILLVNFELFTSPLQAFVFGLTPERAGLDRIAAHLIALFAEGKFYPLFSMLFGMGFGVMLGRARRAGVSFRALYLRRLAVLFLIGLAHSLLIWSGDILLSYAVTGFAMLLLFPRTPPRRQLLWALPLLALPLTLHWLAAGSGELVRADPALQDELAAEYLDWSAEIDPVAAVYRSGSYADAVRQRVEDLWFRLDLELLTLPLLLGLFLLGRWLLESGRLAAPAAHPRFFRGLRCTGLVGLALSALGVWLRADSDPYQLALTLALAATAFTAGGILLALGYLALVVAHAERLAWLAPAGRMALTNYLLQSLCWTWVFYGYGLGLWGQIGRAWQVVLAVAFFGAQVALSRWWLARFRFGPAEWLWRSLTYLRRQPFRR